MNRRLFLLALFLLLLGRAGAEDFRFAWLSDTHLGEPSAAEDLRAAVRDINAQPGLSFVILSGDVTQFGSHDEFVMAKSILDGLHLPCHVIPGNHDCKWSESGATEFAKIWGADRFVFNTGGYCFIGLHQGPVMKMGDGHFTPQDIRWLDATLAGLPANQPIIFVTHYPLDDGIDNWFAVLDRLKKCNTQAVLVGHGHRNKKMNFEGVPAAMGRSNLRANAKLGGYTLAGVTNGVLTLTERDPGRKNKPAWDIIELRQHDYAAMTNSWPRPDYSVNTKYPAVRALWQFDAGCTMASSPAVAGGRAFAGDEAGKMRAFALQTGAVDWEFDASGPIYSTPAAGASNVIFASVDGNIYSLTTADGREQWRFPTGKPIVASPCVTNNIVYIGAGDGKFRALDASTGKLIWQFDGVDGFVETRPLISHGEVIFGAWDQHLYALDATTGKLDWKWMGKSPGDLGVMYSPAAFWPVAVDRNLFVVAPDRYMTDLDLLTGRQIWRTSKWQVRESIGLAPDSSRFYVRTMPGKILAFSAKAPSPKPLWELDAHFGYDINSAMLQEKDGILYYGTKNGLLLAIDAPSGKLLWEHKLGVTVLNTVVPLDNGHEVLVSDVDGKVTLVGASN